MKALFALIHCIIDSIAIRVVGHKCPKCGKRSHHSGRGFWTRGYNDYCRQAISDSGWRCYECGHIEWDHSIDEYRASLPPWCRADGDDKTEYYENN
jgi:ssDNA-binding Zn-finger/Zn-ribbon topoisomerase 1